MYSVWLAPAKIFVQPLLICFFRRLFIFQRPLQALQLPAAARCTLLYKMLEFKRF